MEEQKEQDAVVTPKTIDVFGGFAVMLKRIHIRLIAEGYTIKEGEFIPPKVYTEEAVPSRRTRKRRVLK